MYEKHLSLSIPCGSELGAKFLHFLVALTACDDESPCEECTNACDPISVVIVASVECCHYSFGNVNCACQCARFQLEDLEFSLSLNCQNVCAGALCNSYVPIILDIRAELGLAVGRRTSSI